MHKLQLLILSFLISCSYMQPRRSHFDYLKRGLSKEDVFKKSGPPNSSLFTKNNNILLYNYCLTPMWREIMGGFFTVGLYNISCSKSSANMELVFENNSLIEIHEDINWEKREMERANRLILLKHH